MVILLRRKRPMAACHRRLAGGDLARPDCRGDRKFTARSIKCRDRTPSRRSAGLRWSSPRRASALEKSNSDPSSHRDPHIAATDIDDRHSWFMPGMTYIKLCVLETGEPRDSTSTDLAEIMRIAFRISMRSASSAKTSRTHHSRVRTASLPGCPEKFSPSMSFSSWLQRVSGSNSR